LPLQGLADGDGYASIRAFNAGIATKTNQRFICRLLESLDIHSDVQETKVRIRRHDDLKIAELLPLFKHAKTRQRNLMELGMIIDRLDDSHGKVPRVQVDIIMNLHAKRYTPGKIPLVLWRDYELARSPSSISGIIHRRV
jgi:hypothetical protein